MLSNEIEILSTPTVLLVLRVLHIVAACALVGSVLFHYVILRRAFGLIPPAYAVVIGQRVGNEFNLLGWLTLVTLGLTGLARVLIDGRFFQLLVPDFYGEGAARSLGLMVLGWSVSVFAALVMTFELKPVLMSKLPWRSAPELADVVRRQAQQATANRWMGRLQIVTLVFSLLSVIAGASVAYGGLF